MEVELVSYKDEKEIAIDLIIKFWEEHNCYTSTYEEAYNDLMDWTKTGHRLFFIRYDDEYVGFVHLGSRGCAIDWLEDIFVLPKYQRRGIGSYAIQLVEKIVKEYSESLYIEVAARNRKAIRLYHSIGYDCLNTITVRKDFKPEKCEIIDNESIMDLNFDVKKYK